MTLSTLHIETSLNDWFSNNYAGHVDWGGLDQFDPEADDLESWVHFCVDSIKEESHRKGNKRTYNIRIVVQCWARDIEGDFGKKDFYRVKRKVEAISDLLRQKEIPLYDFELEDEDQVGNCRLFEPVASDETDRADDDIFGYEMWMIIVDGWCQEI